MDWNKDGKNDVLAGDSHGKVTIFLNKGTKKNPVLAAGAPVKSDGKVIDGRGKSHKLAATYSKIHFADWDGDGLRDLLVGYSTTLVFYKNEGSADSPKFAAPEKMEIPGKLPSRPSPYVVDWDGDGKRDLLLGAERLPILFFRNIGTDKSPKLEKGEALNLKGPGFEKGYRCRFDVMDWNNDGKLDILVGNFCRREDRKYGGSLWLFLGK